MSQSSHSRAFMRLYFSYSSGRMSSSVRAPPNATCSRLGVLRLRALRTAERGQDRGPLLANDACPTKLAPVPSPEGASGARHKLQSRHCKALQGAGHHPPLHIREGRARWRLTRPRTAPMSLRSHPLQA